ncbi:MAG: UDP-N-acetylglucosamine 2-epimerase (non-hydrolyzing) [Bradymonadales bacterium]|nr:UDP-N-acetylglucosamine 2-epimerase (non-hydrolyzing) [Bradymonadales bacterium]
MKIMTILGTRPEIIRLSRIIRLLDQHAEHILVHTGQNYDDRLSRIFFEQLEVREPDANMGVRAGSFAAQIGQILQQAERLLIEHHPDRLLILGDTNSGLSAIVARRLGIPVYHMEAGNRCHDDRVPEEVNRRVIDHSSSVLLPYTHRSKENLLAEGFPTERIYVTGNPIKEVIDHYSDRIDASSILDTLGVEPKGYFLVTMHRAENVDVESRLRNLVEALSLLYREYNLPVICSFHPRTRAMVEKFGLSIDLDGVHFLEPFGFFDFIRLERSAFCLLSDSGTVQEEACIFGVPNLTIRDVTERPETLECGSNLLSGDDPETIVRLVGLALARRGQWTPPPEYLASGVANTVVRILLSYRIPDPAERGWRERSRR